MSRKKRNPYALSEWEKKQGYHQITIQEALESLRGGGNMAIYRLDLRSLGIMLELDEEACKHTQVKRVVDENTGEFLYNARIIKCDDDTLLVVKESKFERIEK